jgi:hypothetical protein
VGKLISRNREVKFPAFNAVATHSQGQVAPTVVSEAGDRAAFGKSHEMSRTLDQDTFKEADIENRPSDFSTSR